MYVVVLIAFISANTLAETFPSVAGGRFLIPALIAYPAVSLVIGYLRSTLSLRAMADGDESLRSAFTRHNLLGLLVNFWLVGGLAGLVLSGFGQWTLSGLGIFSLLFVGRLLLMTPFILALVLNWVLDYPFYRIVKTKMVSRQRLMGVLAPDPWSLWEYLGYNLRHQFLFVAVPIWLIMSISDAMTLLPVGETVQYVGSIAGALAVLMLAPAIIVLVWRTDRMPAGELRDELIALSEAMRLRFRKLLVWRTGGMIANAMVMGVLRQVRYVLLSDALLAQLEPREARAVFAHEAGHIKGHHLFYMMVFSISSILLCVSVGELIAWAIGLDYWTAQGIFVVLLAAAWLLGFGWISRRFERQADVVAAWYSAEDGPSDDGRITPDGAAIMARSLERIAALNGMSAAQFNWRHGSIRWRVTYIMWLGSTAGNRRDIDRLVRRIKLGLLAALVVSVGATMLVSMYGS